MSDTVQRIGRLEADLDGLKAAPVATEARCEQLPAEIRQLLAGRSEVPV